MKSIANKEKNIGKYNFSLGNVESNRKLFNEQRCIRHLLTALESLIRMCECVSVFTSRTQLTMLGPQLCQRNELDKHSH